MILQLAQGARTYPSKEMDQVPRRSEPILIKPTSRVVPSGGFQDGSGAASSLAMRRMYEQATWRMYNRIMQQRRQGYIPQACVFESTRAPSSALHVVEPSKTSPNRSNSYRDTHYSDEEIFTMDF